jgi:hypothetical protein
MPETFEGTLSQWQHVHYVRSVTGPDGSGCRYTVESSDKEKVFVVFRDWAFEVNPPHAIANFLTVGIA